MRHGKKVNHLSRKKAHRDALLSNLAISLILHKRINTTLAKAKALRTYIEPLVTKAKANTTHARRIVFSYLENKEAIQELFGPVREKIGERPGGYLRVIRTGYRPGDGTATAMIEFVDFNEIYTGAKAGKVTEQKRKTRRGGKAKAAGQEDEGAGEKAEPKAKKTAPKAKSEPKATAEPKAKAPAKSRKAKKDDEA